MQRVLSRLRGRRLLAASTRSADAVGSLQQQPTSSEHGEGAKASTWWQRDDDSARGSDGIVRLDNGDVCSVYLGIDPTADGLHVGHLVGIMALRAFQREGFRPLALVGGATGLIGDPSGRATERAMLETSDVERNVEGIRADLERVLEFGGKEPNAAQLVNNLDWYRGMSALELLRDVGKHFRVSAMMSRESVKARLETSSDETQEGLSFTEFSYQLLQGYDFLHLYRTESCRVQIGGSDQWGNIAAGTDLIRRATGDTAEALGVTVPLLTNRAGEKFGKSAGNAVWLAPDKTSDFELYQFFMRAEDEMVEDLLYKLTELPEDEVAAIAKAHGEAPEKREAQRRLAQSVVQMVRGPTGLRRAEVATQALFGGDLDALSAEDLLSIDAPRVTLSREQVQDRTAIDVFAAAKAVASKSEAKRLAASGGLYVQNHRVPDASYTLDLARDAAEGRVILLRSGKRKYTIVSVQDAE
ncbi:Tyrosine--tRNA ligase, mitochondrial [Hondaea fermentalgiana]|uniref:Tyrosine--tRNA ligase n=1 Tax=Hondaea fermentalgiana TaxID=2315210 RepID=A0A2R5GC52_9STRA|nr:Tyrosine--tRNA ligase, mitochondrial [Hondaea fermentalgiana]|eukprot:GBG28582.1 Tyrosine--tRNA ligase, mitochondrial [Hondaea fermentalgiana]